jgi:hypothetical protein
MNLTAERLRGNAGNGGGKSIISIAMLAPLRIAVGESPTVTGGSPVPPLNQDGVD